MVSSYSKIFEVLKKSCEIDWHQYIDHKFVKKLSDGSLSKGSFLKYLKQDYIFLYHFSRAWALAIAKSNSINEMRITSQVVNALINEEIKLHIEYCADNGIKYEDLIKTSEASQNLAYTRYVLEAGYSGSFLDLIATLSPCVFGYGEIGLKLKESHTSSKYKKWIDTYSGAEYQNLCKTLGKMVDASFFDRLGNNFERSGQWQQILKHFKTATNLEKDFWSVGFD
tara:strand:+ start:3610 stop:4284 length:675 start_codon:yes stop_codon:yes gene_type:complete